MSSIKEFLENVAAVQDSEKQKLIKEREWKVTKVFKALLSVALFALFVMANIFTVETLLLLCESWSLDGVSGGDIILCAGTVWMWQRWIKNAQQEVYRD